MRAIRQQDMPLRTTPSMSDRKDRLATRVSTRSSAAWIAIAIASALAGCNQQPAPAPVHALGPKPRTITPIDVARIDLGRAIKPDGTISEPTTSFKPTDTLFAAVTTQRPGHDIKLTARWIYGDDRIANETSKTINPANILVTDFQVSNGAGWPLGQYKLVMLVNGTPVAVTAFAVNR